MLLDVKPAIERRTQLPSLSVSCQTKNVTPFKVMTMW
jgi:hypothetical protein